jgi:hypothetical protein
MHNIKQIYSVFAFSNINGYTEQIIVVAQLHVFNVTACICMLFYVYYFFFPFQIDGLGRV